MVIFFIPWYDKENKLLIMKTLSQKILIICAIILGASFVSNFSTPENVSAAACDTSFLGLVSWDCNTNFNNPSSIPTESDITNGIWIIVTNIITDITVIAAYLVLGYVIYGGYLYTMSGGDPGKVASGKKTLTHAFAGLAIVMGATIIMNTIRIALSANFSANCATSNCVANPGLMVTSVIQWVVGVIGFVAAIFVVYGGITYIISSGDPGKVKKAKDIILYAVIGLVIVALAEIITAFVSNTINNASKSAYINQTTISKEVHEINHL